MSGQVASLVSLKVDFHCYVIRTCLRKCVVPDNIVFSRSLFKTGDLLNTDSCWYGYSLEQQNKILVGHFQMASRHLRLAR